jgi:hypothetical protein
VQVKEEVKCSDCMCYENMGLLGIDGDFVILHW